MEMVLGVDNIVFISLLANDLPEKQQNKGRTLGVIAALVLRIGLLTGISWIMTLQKTLFNPLDWVGITDKAIHDSANFSGRDVILFAGGLFLIYKSVVNIHGTIEKSEKAYHRHAPGFWATVGQIALLDLVLSIDSVITAVGMAKRLPVMIAAVCAAMLVMLVATKSVGNFIKKHPSVKLLALAFLLLIGVSLIMESVDSAIPKGYIYFAMAFSVFVEVLIIRLVNKKKIRLSS